jgi:hypothetical protein
VRITNVIKCTLCFYYTWRILHLVQCDIHLP